MSNLCVRNILRCIKGKNPYKNSGLQKKKKKGGGTIFSYQRWKTL
jgi:hypothetical protein